MTDAVDTWAAEENPNGFARRMTALLVQAVS